MAGLPNRDDRDLYYWLALRMAPGVGAIHFARLIERFGTPEAVFHASPQALSRLPRLPGKTIEAIKRFDWGPRVEEEIERTETAGIQLITIKDVRYPRRLKEIYNPPPLLWMAGEPVEADRNTVAIVGSRAATEYGRNTSARLARELIGEGITVVSGVALGIDAAAHRGALAAGGRTIGVLGCGIDIRYPRSNRDLYEKIPLSGFLISEFALGTAPEPGHFPLRNRIISGLSLAVIVVEAAARSGALITARLALEQNREVMAVPGRAGSNKSGGAHILLRQGAALVESGGDVVREIEPLLNREVAGRPEKTGPGPEVELSFDEKNVWEALGEGELHIDIIGRKSGEPPHKLTALLLQMEIKGLIKQLPGMRFVRTDGPRS